MIEVKCGTCGKRFPVKPFRLRHSNALYCSRKCHHNGMAKKVNLRCSTCGNEVVRTPSKVKNSKSGQFFCNKSCQTKWRNRYFSGEKHKNWSHGKAINYRRILANSDRKKVCRHCGEDDKRVLAVHHIDENRRNNNLENLMWLCHNCHHLVHFPDIKTKM